MHWESVLSSSVEVAIAIAGFSGIIAVFGKREGEPLEVSDKLWLQVLLTASGAALFFSFLPYVLLEAGFSVVVVWKLGSGAQALWFIGITAYRSLQARRVGSNDVTLTSGLVTFVGVIAVIISQIVNVLVYAEAWLYVAGVLFQLAVGFHAFTRLLLDHGIRADDNEST